MEPENGAASQQLSHRADAGQSQGKAQSHADAVKQGGNGGIFGSIALRTPKDDTVYNDQWDVDSQRVIQRRNIGLQQKLHHGDEAGHDHDKGRNTHLIRNDLPKGGDHQVAQRENHGGRKSHAKAVHGRGCHRQRRAHAQGEHKGWIFSDDAVVQAFSHFIHQRFLLPAPLRSAASVLSENSTVRRSRRPLRHWW